VLVAVAELLVFQLAYITAYTEMILTLIR